MRRGVGLCGQQARALTSALRAGNIEASPVAFDNHVVVQADIGGEGWILDSSLNTIIPHSLKKCHANPEIVRSYYEEAKTTNRHELSEKNIDRLVEIFGTESGTLTPPYDIHRRFEVPPVHFSGCFALFITCHREPPKGGPRFWKLCPAAPILHKICSRSRTY